MTREDEIKKIALCYAHDELKDNQSPIEDVVAAAFIDGANYADSHPHWISVEDELPPMHCHLQDLGESTYGRGKIFCDSLPVVTHRVDGCIDMHCLMFNGEKNEFVWGGWNGSLREPFDGSMITHWMKPTPPTCSEFPNKCEKGGEE